jgi:acetyl esterase/lipase
VTITDLSALKAPPDPLLNSKDDFFRNFRATIPVKLQYALRDSGLLRLIVDSLVFAGVPSLLQAYPTAWKDFLTLSGLTSTSTSNSTILFQSMQYGKHRSQHMELIQSREPVEYTHAKKWVVFIHGGAWGSGFPLIYRLVANSFVSQGYQVAIVGYRTYPDTVLDGQIDDIVQAIEFLRCKEMKKDERSESLVMTLIGHSSGAHISMLGMLQSKLQGIERFIGISGVYDIPRHYQFESKRGVERISPLAPVCGGNLSQWKQNSPSRQQSTSSITRSRLPPILLLHGEIDSTVPYTSSVGLYQSLIQQQQPRASEKPQIDLKVLNGVEHSETMFHLMFGGETRDVLLNWIKN